MAPSGAHWLKDDSQPIAGNQSTMKCHALWLLYLLSSQVWALHGENGLTLRGSLALSQAGVTEVPEGLKHIVARFEFCDDDSS